MHFLEEENLLCFYDWVKQLAIIKPQNAIREANIDTMRQWLASLTNDETMIRGLIVNLSDIKQFKIDKLDELFTLNEKATAFIVANKYQETLLERQAMPAERCQIAHDYNEAFDYLQSQTSFDDGHLAEDLMYLNTNEASMLYDAEKHRFYITYFGVVSPKVTSDVYVVIFATIEKYGVKHIHGADFDFRHVTSFSNANLNTVRSTSTNINTSYDLSHIAVALIVGNLIQERMVMIAMKVTPQEERKRVVHSSAEASEFINEFHNKYAFK